MEGPETKQDPMEDDDQKTHEYQVTNQFPFDLKDEYELEEKCIFVKVEDIKQELQEGKQKLEYKKEEVQDEEFKEESKENVDILLELVGAEESHLQEKSHYKQEKYFEKLPTPNCELDTSLADGNANGYEPEDKTTSTNHKKLEDSGITFDTDLTCYKCDKEFLTALMLKRHIVFHHTPDMTCDVCNKRFDSKITLNDHIKKEHFKYANCKICGLKVSRHSIRAHEKIHANKYNFQCDLCKLSFKLKGGLKIHINSVHVGKKTFKCNFCEKSFSNSGNRSAHIAVHHRNNKDKNKNYVCDICNRSFYLERYLKRHRKIHTGEDKKHICNICGLKCRSRIDIERHMFTHTGGAERPHKCDQCQKSFIKASHLVRHQVVHSDMRPCKCEQCGKSYKDSRSLKVHISSVHDERCFECSSCRKWYFNEHSFKRHMRAQNCQPDKFEFECCCGKVFKHKFSFKRHKSFHCRESKKRGLVFL